MASESGPQVDIMNDPAYNASSASGLNGNGEPDHCRICRSEGSREEPLFHPCKCSGSIKFVHQDWYAIFPLTGSPPCAGPFTPVLVDCILTFSPCYSLLEWLQHSQKKHCELCKTPFHFTKLYDPQMPTTLPTPLFLNRLLRHLFRNLLLWARALLVGCVWLGGLPYCVRWMWRMWFWLSDGGWWTDQAYNRTGTASATTTPLTNLPGTPTVSSAVMNSTSSAFGSGILAFLRSPLLSGPVMSPVNGGKVAANVTSAINATLSNGTITIRVRLGGLFIDPSPFHNFTRYPAVNGVIVDIFEGQLLTALIVISFILIFLIREWVVQQQPALGGAVVLPQLDELQVPQAENIQLPQINPPPPPPPPPPQDRLAREHELARALEQFRGELPPVHHRVIANPRRRRPFPVAAPAADPRLDPGVDSVQDWPTDFSNPNTDIHTMQKYGQGHLLGGGNSEPTSTGNRLGDLGESSNQSMRRPQVNRKAMSQPAEIRRAMEERPEASDHGSQGPSTSTPYQFEFSFNGRGQTPSPLYTPESGNSSGSRTPARSGRAPSPIGYNRGIIDTGAPGGERPLYSFSGNGSPKITAVGESASSSPTESQINKGKQPEPPFQAYENSIDNEDQWEDEEEEDDMVDSKGKGKEIKTPSAHADLSSYHESSAVGSSDFATANRPDFAFKARSDPIRRAPTPVAARYPPPSISLPSTPTTSGSLLDHAGNESTSIGLGKDAHQGCDEAGGVSDIGVQGVEHTFGNQSTDTPTMEYGAQNVEVGAIQGSPAPVQEPVPHQPPRPFDLWDREAREAAEAIAENDTGTDDGTDDDDGTDAEDDGENEVGDGPAIELPPDALQAIADEDAADDFDGIMELIGMRGPLAGLLQNVAFSIVLITTTVALGVAFPYVMGKIVMIILVQDFPPRTRSILTF